MRNINKQPFPSDIFERDLPGNERPGNKRPENLLSTLRIKDINNIPNDIKDSTIIKNSFEEPTEEIRKLLSHLYSGAENSISDCIYSDL